MKRGLEPIAISTETKTTASSPEVVRSDSKPGTTVPEKKAIIEEVKVVKAEPKNVDNEPKAEDELKVCLLYTSTSSLGLCRGEK